MCPPQRTKPPAVAHTVPDKNPSRMRSSDAEDQEQGCSYAAPAAGGPDGAERLTAGAAGLVLTSWCAGDPSAARRVHS